MKYIFICFISLLFANSLLAQQTPRFTQFTLNNLGNNPAYAGTHAAQVEFMAGNRQQWTGFAGAPITTFFGVSYGHRGKYNYKGIHGFSAYVESDNAAGLKNNSFYVGYAYHLRLINGVNIGFGLMAGSRTFSMSSRLFNSADPAFINTRSFVTTVTIIMYLFLQYISNQT